jgi:hypothetical protein
MLMGMSREEDQVSSSVDMHHDPSPLDRYIRNIEIDLSNHFRVTSEELEKYRIRYRQLQEMEIEDMNTLEWQDYHGLVHRIAHLEYIQDHPGTCRMYREQNYGYPPGRIRDLSEIVEDSIGSSSFFSLFSEGERRLLRWTSFYVVVYCIIALVIAGIFIRG